MRQFVLPRFPEPGGALTLEGRDYRYLVQVLRKEEGERIDARLPDGRLCPFLVSSVDRKAKTLVLIPAGGEDASLPGGETPLPGESMPPLAGVPDGFPRIVLFQWVLKGPRMDQVVRQATETGVENIVPVIGDRCVSDESGPGRHSRWERIVREARQQSGSPVATRVHNAVPASGVPESWGGFASGRSAAAVVFTEAPLARKPLHRYLCDGPGLIALAVGPEGGMSVRELKILSGAGFESVHFKTNVLRAETCALYGIATVQNALTEFESWQLKE